MSRRWEDEYQFGSYVVEQGYETEVHVELLMTMKQSQLWIVGDKIHFSLLITADHYDILHYTCSRLADELGQFEAMPVKMDGVDVVAGIAHADAIALALLQAVGRFHPVGKYFAIDGPHIEAVIGSVPLGKGHFDDFVRLANRGGQFAKSCITPMKRPRSRPRRFCFVSRILYDDAHAVTPIIIGAITHDPHARTIHLDNCRNALSCS